MATPGDNGLQPRSSEMGGWIAMHAGQSVTIVKTHWGSPEPNWTYEGVIVPHDRTGDWIAAEAPWGRDDADVDGVQFITGGKIIEYFSPTKRFNVFQVFAPNGDFTGIYANVTAPTVIAQNDAGKPVLTWEDHWLDVVRLPDGTMKVLDEDEYQQSGVPESDPELDKAIRSALDELVDQLGSGSWDP